jgi:hypothetical protein
MDYELPFKFSYSKLLSASSGACNGAIWILGLSPRAARLILRLYHYRLLLLNNHGLLNIHWLLTSNLINDGTTNDRRNHPMPTPAVATPPIAADMVPLSQATNR